MRGAEVTGDLGRTDPGIRKGVKPFMVASVRMPIGLTSPLKSLSAVEELVFELPALICNANGLESVSQQAQFKRDDHGLFR